jgi:hypothetical protein
VAAQLSRLVTVLISVCAIPLSLVWWSLCLQATYFALRNSYKFLTPNLWKEQAVARGPFAQFTDFLKESESDK